MHSRLRNNGLFMVLAILLAGPTLIRALTRELVITKPRQHLNDFAGVVESSTAARLENVLTNLNDRTEINFVVVLTKTAGQEDLYLLSNSLANRWTIGSATSTDKSVLLFITTDTGKFFTLPSGGAARALPSGLVGAMGRRMRPVFDQGQYGLGLETGLKLFVDIIGQYSNFTFAALDSSQTNPATTSQIAKASFTSTEAKTPTSARAPERKKPLVGANEPKASV